GAPAWARQYRRRQEAAHAASTATHALRAGDHAGAGTSVSLAEDRS
ncbi:P-type conjugative transfer protein TrbL, partial [Phenylobacterium soli]